MGVRSSRHLAVLEELAEWWEDISEARIGSRVVLVEVPPGWGATMVLQEFRINGCTLTAQPHGLHKVSALTAPGLAPLT